VFQRLLGVLVLSLKISVIDRQSEHINIIRRYIRLSGRQDLVCNLPYSFSKVLQDF